MSKNRSLVFLFISAIALFCTAAAAADSAPWSEAEVRRILAERIDEYGQSVGIAVGLIDAERSVVVGYGKLDSGDDRVPDGDTVFEIGSVTKVFTAILLADAVERGDLSLDDPVQKLLGESASVPGKNGKQITLYHLTTHTSGLPRMPDNFQPADPQNPFADYSVQQMLDFLSGHELTREPGAVAEYSNYGVGLLGHLLALRAGSSYEALVQKRICAPLEMNETTIVLTDGMRGRLAPGHDSGLDPAANWDIPTLAGAGALRSTINDMLKFVAANLGLVEVSKLSGAMQATQQAREEFGGPDMEIGLGWIIRKEHDRTIHWHNGGTGGYHSFVGFDKDRGLGVVVLSNSTNSIDDIGFHLLEPKFELAKFAAPVAIDPEILDAYVGEYQLVPGFVLTVTREGSRLFVQATNQPNLEVFPESETTFFYRVVDARISFVRDGDGPATHLVLHQGGLEQKAKRLDESGTVEFGPGESITLPEETLQRYVGRYELQPGVIVAVTRDGVRLLVQITGQDAVEIFAESETRFFYKIVDAQITFNVGESGAIESLTLHQGGREMPAGRLD